MNAILGRASYGNVTGKVFLNGVEGSLGAIPSLVGFVPQDDIVVRRVDLDPTAYMHAASKSHAPS